MVQTLAKGEAVRDVVRKAVRVAERFGDEGPTLAGILASRGKRLRPLPRGEAQAHLAPLFPVAEPPPLLVEKFLEVYNERPAPIAPDALPYLVALAPFYAEGLGKKGPPPGRSVFLLATAAFRAMTGHTFPAQLGLDREVVDWGQRLLKTSELLLLAWRRASSLSQTPGPLSTSPS